jgi:uncharacterized protein
MEWFNILIISIGSLVGGFIGAQVGGGGLITLPILLLLGIPTPNAIAINRFGAIFLNAFAAHHYIKEKKLPIKTISTFALLGAAGSIFGAYIILNIDALLLKKIIVYLLIILLIIITTKKDIGLIERKYTLAKKHMVFFIPLLLVLGIYGGSVGVASTTFFALFFVFQGQSFSQAMGFATFMNAVIAAVATVVFLAYGAVIFQYAIPQAIALSIGSSIGTKFAIKKGNKWLKLGFAVMSSVFIIKLLAEIYFR